MGLTRYGRKADRSFSNTARPKAAAKNRFLAPLCFARNDMSSRAERTICFSLRQAKNLAVHSTESVRWPPVVALACGLGWILTGNARTASAWSTKAGPGSVSVVTAERADEVQRFAAAELVRYLRQVTGEDVDTNHLDAKHKIYLGTLPGSLTVANTQQLRADVQSLQEDGFVARSSGADIIILGKGSRGDLYGCYAFLERLGVRWFFPGVRYEFVPQRSLNWSASLDLKESPAFRDRILFYWPNNYSRTEEWIDFAAKARLNRIAFHYTWPARDWYINQRSTLQPECKKRGMMIEVGGHFLSSLLPRTLFPTHSDWFRMNDQGRRTPDFNFNPFSAEALEALGASVVHYLGQMPEASLYHVWPDDIEGGGWSSEPGRQEYTASDQSLLVANSLVERLRRDLPEANLAFLAYHDTVFPPCVVKPRPGIIFFYAPRERCYAHALNDAQCALNRQYSQALEQALPAFGSPNAEVFEYYVDQILYENLNNPPLPEVLSEDARYYHKLGIPGLGALMTNTSEFVTPALNMYLYPKALWNPDVNLRSSVTEYAELYFGDAGLDAYFVELEGGLQDVLKICDYVHPGDAWDAPRVDRESDEALSHHVANIERGLTGSLAQAAMLLLAATGKARNQEYRDRIEREKLALDFTLLQARLYYHLLKGEYLFRLSRRQSHPEAELGCATESVLARYTWRKVKELVVLSGLKGQPLIPSPDVLEHRVDDFVKEQKASPSSLGGVNPMGFSVDPLEEQLMRGMTGYTVAGSTGSTVVIWTDLAESAHTLRPGASGLVWKDEFGQPLSAGDFNLFRAPIVVEAAGMSADKLFNALAQSQLR